MGERRDQIGFFALGDRVAVSGSYEGDDWWLNGAARVEGIVSRIESGEALYGPNANGIFYLNIDLDSLHALPEPEGKGVCGDCIRAIPNPAFPQDWASGHLTLDFAADGSPIEDIDPAQTAWISLGTKGDESAFPMVESHARVAPAAMVHGFDKAAMIARFKQHYGEA